MSRPRLSPVRLGMVLLAGLLAGLLAWRELTIADALRRLDRQQAQIQEAVRERDAQQRASCLVFEAAGRRELPAGAPQVERDVVDRSRLAVELMGCRP